jgi:hypothetical protein
MTAVFLSAGFPSGARGEAVAPYYPADIASAASAVAEAVLRSGAMLVFGGHPNVTPIVLQIASILRVGQQVTIYQSEYFADQITAEVRRLVDVEGATMLMTATTEELETSLEAMRRQMFTVSFSAAFFIGGMSGIFDEFDLLGEIQPSASRFVFEAPGGQAALIPPQYADRPKAASNSVTSLAGRAYASLALDALATAGVHRPYDNDREL